MVQLTQKFFPEVCERVQRLLWPAEELGELKPPPRKPPVRLSKTKRNQRRKMRALMARRQSFLWGTGATQQPKQHKNLFHLFPDIPCDMVDEETQRMGAIVIAERSAEVRAGWSRNKEHKANHYPAQPVVFEPLSDHESHLESRDSYD